jgi:hypothetical protein
MPGPDVDELRRAFGGPDAVATIEAYCARGPDGIAELFASLQVPFAAASERDGRAGFEDEGLCLHRLASCYPEDFLAQIEARPRLGEREGVLAALAQVPGLAAERLLLAALSFRGGWQRWLALRGLLARGSAAVLPHLPRLLRDRDGMVGFTALDGLRRWGRGEQVPALLAYIERAAPGGVEFGLDAIEAICAREGLPLPVEHPGPRLEHVTVAGDAVELRVIVASRVGVGEPLARVDAVVLRSPWAGVVSAIDHEPPRLRITIRREAGPAAG